ncbi:MAG: hypothetical protein IKC55_04760, partial [Clostridia bacterium]|nr:hypothetical protein [Clostridia bacterium]
MKQAHKLIVSGAREYIGIAVAADVFLLHAGKMPLKGFVKILPAARSQSKAHAEVYNSLYAHILATVQNGVYVLLTVVYNGQDGAKPDNSGNPGITQSFQRFNTSFG